jgi:hypothetical protein
LIKRKKIKGMEYIVRYSSLVVQAQGRFGKMIWINTLPTNKE